MGDGHRGLREGVGRDAEGGGGVGSSSSIFCVFFIILYLY